MSHKLRLPIVLIALALALLAPGGPEPPPLDLIVRPLIAFAPTDVHVTLRIARADENRSWFVSLNADTGMYRGSGGTLAGVAAPIVHEIWWPQITAGTYEVRASVYGQGGRLRAMRAAWVRYL